VKTHNKSRGFAGELSSFEQTLDLTTATVTVKATSKASGRSFSATVAVDAHSNTITTLLNSSQPVSLSVVVQSVHPSKRFAYAGGFAGPGPECGEITVFFSRLYLKMLILPRQAQDKHRESIQKGRRCFAQGPMCSTPLRLVASRSPTATRTPTCRRRSITRSNRSAKISFFFARFVD
jgi:hypothetical protein